MTRKGDAAGHPGGAAQPAKDERDAENGGKPSPGDGDRRETGCAESGGAIDMDTARERAS